MSEMIASLAAAVEWIFAQVVMEVMFLSSAKLRFNELGVSECGWTFSPPVFIFNMTKLNHLDGKIFTETSS